MKSVLDGCLLGDGSLVLHKNARNPYFEYCSSEKDHINFVWKEFKELCTPRYSDGPIKYNIYDKRTSKTYTGYNFRTRTSPTLLEEYCRWYKDKKIIPKDVILDNVSLLYWYIGDGCLLRNSRNGDSAEIKLSTHCFTHKEVEFLCERLSKYNPRIRNSEKKQPILIIPKSDTRQFLDDIGSIYPKCYAYKWDWTPYKNKRPKFTSEEIFLKLQDRYLKGESIYSLSKESGVAINSIKNYLRKKDLYIPKKRSEYGRKIKHG